MPQMAPISWLILMVLFSCCFLIFNILNYFCLGSKNSTSKENKLIDNKSLTFFMNWKW